MDDRNRGPDNGDSLTRLYGQGGNEDLPNCNNKDRSINKEILVEIKTLACFYGDLFYKPVLTVNFINIHKLYVAVKEFKEARKRKKSLTHRVILKILIFRELPNLTVNLKNMM